MVGGDPPLAVCWTSQRHLRRLAGHEVLDFDGVADGIDVRIGGLKMIVDTNAATRPDLQPSIDRQLVFRAHAHAQDDQLSR